ncbi:AAA family ATPase [Ignatzschineria cameli]|uniref:AAA family ATPase n=1 Tax=Ignatzschineria cameli TaxID=2182793 RepID=UPI000D61FB8C|nr:AAA family ATPase [Ignatzschineria cameli]PWD87265.1 hypothetical protein DC080_00085 [Ignatzschineria cameli]
MRRDEFMHKLPWLSLGPIEEVMRRVEQHISMGPGDFFSIYGPSGCGKSRFMMELSRRLNEYGNIVAREVTAGQGSIFTKIAALLECEASEEAIIERLKEIPPTGLKMVLLVDDADQLTSEELSFIYRTKEAINKKGLRRGTEEIHVVIVLFMDLNNQDIYSKELLLHSKSFTMGPINHMQIKELVWHIYKHHGKTADCSSRDLNRLHAFSYGYPGRIVRLVTTELQPAFTLNKALLSWIILLSILVIGMIYAAFNYEKSLALIGFGESEPTEEVLQYPEILIPSKITEPYFEGVKKAIIEAEKRVIAAPLGIVIIQGESSKNEESIDQ